MKNIRTISDLIESLKTIRSIKGDISAINAISVIVNGEEIDIIGIEWPEPDKGGDVIIEG